MSTPAAHAGKDTYMNECVIREVLLLKRENGMRQNELSMCMSGSQASHMN